MLHTFTLLSFTLKGYDDGDNGFAQCTLFYEVDGVRYLNTEVGNNAGEAVANACFKVVDRRHVPLVTVVKVVLPLALEAILSDDPPPTEEAADDLPF